MRSPAPRRLRIGGEFRSMQLRGKPADRILHGTIRSLGVDSHDSSLRLSVNHSSDDPARRPPASLSNARDFRIRACFSENKARRTLNLQGFSRRFRSFRKIPLKKSVADPSLSRDQRATQHSQTEFPGLCGTFPRLIGRVRFVCCRCRWGDQRRRFSRPPNGTFRTVGRGWG